MASAPDFESGGWGFESLRDRFVGMGILVCIYMVGQLVSAIGLVVKYLVANEVPRVRFPDGAYLAPVAQLVAPRSYVPMVQGSSPCRSTFERRHFSQFLTHFCAIFGSIPTRGSQSGSTVSYVHTMVKAPDPFRTLKLSTIGPAQYCGGGPRGNRR